MNELRSIIRRYNEVYQIVTLSLQEIDHLKELYFTESLKINDTALNKMAIRVTNVQSELAFASDRFEMHSKEVSNLRHEITRVLKLISQVELIYYLYCKISRRSIEIN